MKFLTGLKKSPVKRFLALSLSVLIITLSCATVTKQSAVPVVSPIEAYSISIAHINDTHAHLEQTKVTIKYNRSELVAALGGFTRLASAIGDLRKKHANFLFLHAGDVFTGTLYFTKYLGAADSAFFHLMGLNAVTLGNHEFDRGPPVLADFLRSLKSDGSSSISVLSANTDTGSEDALAGLIEPYKIFEIGGRKVGVIGLTTQETPRISSPGGKITFSDPFKVAEHYVTELKAQGINIIILLTHVGYDVDLELAKKISGVDLIIGGHSHTLLGDDDLMSYGFWPHDRYPKEVRGKDGNLVLVLQSWEYAKELGFIKVFFNNTGEVIGYEPEPVMLLSPANDEKPYMESFDKFKAEINNKLRVTKFSEFPEDESAKKLLDTYKKPLESLSEEVVAVALENMPRGRNKGPGVIIADSFLYTTKNLNTQLSIVNAGGVRAGFIKGNITIGDVYTVMPFNNTLYVMNVLGRDLKDALESMTSFNVDKSRAQPFMYVSGVTFNINEQKPEGQRISDIEILPSNGSKKQVMEMDKTYRIVTSNYLATGGDNFKVKRDGKMVSLLNVSSYSTDTGFTDSETFIEYAKSLKEISNHVKANVR
ncbi:MAG: 5'-nucleotidase C-terminal domain-containing protein [Nitrospirae bacterium]|nr:5'-nucleotidase C-terminal domain-containing protein [Nitrospirota bacterium]